MTDGFDTPTAPPPPPPSDFGPPPLADFGPPPPPPPSGGRGTLRRSSSDRVVAGVAGGLGEYFGLDPVLFRVLFAVTSFFGGAGVLAYIIGWAVIPERGAAQAPLDGVVTALRRRHVPLWLVITAAVVLLWAGVFSWWAPGPAIPIVIAVVILVSVFTRRQVDIRKAAATAPTAADAAGTPTTPAPGPNEAWLPETRSWIAESSSALQKKLRRTAPVRWATLGVLVVTIAVLAISDAIGGILLPVYFWAAGAILLAGLVVGLILRRTPWTLTLLLLPVVAGLIAFGGSRASLHDGAGQTTWTPTTSADLQSQYRLAFGRTTLDLRGLTLTSPQTVDVTMAAGQVRILVPSTMNVTLQANVHLGVVQIDPDGRAVGTGPNDVSGVNISREVAAPAGATGAPLTIKVHLADGNVSLIHS